MALSTRATNARLGSIVCALACHHVGALAALLADLGRSETRLCLSGESLGDAGCATLARGLGQCGRGSGIAALALGGTGMGAEGASALASVLQRDSVLTALDVHANPALGDAGVCALAGVLAARGTVTRLATLNLSNTALGVTGCAALARALEANSSLLTLELQHNRIDAAAVVALATAWPHNSSLTRIELSHNAICDAGVQALVQALLPNASVRTLGLSDNRFGAVAAETLASLLRRGGLADLDVGGNSIRAAGARALADALVGNKTLTRLGVAHCALGDDGIAHLSATLRCDCGALSTLDIASNAIGQAGADSLVDALQLNTCITHIELKGNAFADPWSAPLAAALAYPVHLNLAVHS